MYAIARHGKIDRSGKGVAVAHNHRLVSSDLVQPTGKDDSGVNPQLSHLNGYFTDARTIQRINEKLPGKRRKDAVEAVEMILGASPEFFDGIEKDRAKLAKHPTFLAWAKKTREWAETEFGDNLVDLVLHMDETSPHFHALAVPLTKDGRLCAKEITARAEMQRRQTEYAAAVKQFGLERGESAADTRRQHNPLKKKAVAQESEKAIAAAGLIAALLSASEQVKAGGNALAVAQKKIERMQGLNQESLRASLAAETGLAKAEKALAAKDSIINGLRVENGAMAKELKMATAQDHQLVAEVAALRAENANYRATVEQLEAVNAVLVEQAGVRLAAQEKFWKLDDELKAGPPGAGRAGMWGWSPAERKARVDELCAITEATDGMHGEERALRALQKALEAPQEALEGLDALVEPRAPSRAQEAAAAMEQDAPKPREKILTPIQKRQEYARKQAEAAALAAATPAAAPELALAKPTERTITLPPKTRGGMGGR